VIFKTDLFVAPSKTELDANIVNKDSPIYRQRKELRTLRYLILIFKTDLFVAPSKTELDANIVNKDSPIRDRQRKELRTLKTGVKVSKAKKKRELKLKAKPMAGCAKFYVPQFSSFLLHHDSHPVPPKLKRVSQKCALLQGF